MSQKSKLVKLLFTRPSPTDFSWDDAVKILGWAGFKEHCSGGSHYIFENADGLRFSMSKTHPQGVLKRYQITSVVEFLADNPAIKELRK